MSNQSRLEALRNLAERPGTEAEGLVAREMLARLEAKLGTEGGDGVDDYLSALHSFTRGDITFQEYVSRASPVSRQRLCKCPCGDTFYMHEKCLNAARHLAVWEEIREKFHKKDRIYYNRWAYPQNSTGIVAAHVPLKRENGDYPWAWISIRLDGKAARQVPILSSRGWHLSHEPVADEEYQRLSCP